MTEQTKEHIIETVKSTAGHWMFFLGALLLLSGVYGALRIIHVSARGVPYPSSGVLPSTILFGSSNLFPPGSESDCDPYLQTYYDKDGLPRPATAEEKAVEEQVPLRCKRGFDEHRSKMKQYDRNLSAFLIFVGGGLVLATRFRKRYLA